MRVAQLAMRSVWRSVAVTTAVVAPATGCQWRDKPRPAGEATVVAVVDGDTVIVRIGDKDESVRLIGIDTPETVDRNKPVECYGPEASALAKELLPAQTAVRLERDVEARDAYDRLLVYVFRSADDMFINREIASRGAARELVIEPNVAYTAIIADAVAEARRADRGLWSGCPNP